MSTLADSNPRRLVREQKLHRMLRGRINSLNYSDVIRRLLPGHDVSASILYVSTRANTVCIHIKIWLAPMLIQSGK